MMMNNNHLHAIPNITMYIDYKIYYAYYNFRYKLEKLSIDFISP